MRNKLGHDVASQWRQSVSTLALALGASALIFAASAPARADDSASVAKLEKEMHRLEAQHAAEIKALKVQIHQIQAHRGGPMLAPGGVVTKGPYEPCTAPFVTMTPNHEFGLSSCDGQNTINLTGRVHMDTGGYVNYSHFGAGFPTGLASGVNFRRARIGVQGKFMGDWDYALIYDFGGTSDGFGGSAPGSLPGGAVSGIENAFITYKGFYNHHQPFPVAITMGAIDVPFTLSESMSSNDLLFMERATPQVLATSFGGSDGRTAIGATSNDKNYFVGAWLTGPTTGQLHTLGVSGLGPQFSALGRAAYTFNVDPANNATIHIGGNYAYTFDPREGANLEGFSLSDRPELRIDPTSLFSTGVLPANNGQVLGAEFAASYQNAFVQGEYYHYIINTNIGTTAGTLAGGTPGPADNFDGGYVEASYTFGGHRHYNPTSGGYSGVVPDKPFILGTDGWGALEVAGTFSIVDSNSSALTTLAIPGTGFSAYTAGKQVAYGAGLNWYPNLNMKFMLDYEHVNVDHYSAFNGPATAGATVDWVAARTQFMW
jgi:phosphate-selective porin OprO/OprP